MVKTLGKVLITPKGEWDKNLKYEKLDIVKVKIDKTTSGYIASADIPENTDISDFRWVNLYDVIDGDVTDEFKVALAEAYKNLQEANKVKDDLISYVGVIPSDAESKDVVSYIQEVAKNIIVDNSLKEKVNANTDAINILNGTDDGSVKKTVADEIEKVIDNAPESRNTLKKISDWIDEHTSSTTEMNKQINVNKEDIANLKSLIGTLPPTAESKDLVHYIAEYVSGMIIDPDLSDYVKSSEFESAVGRIATLESDVSILKESVNNGYEIISIETIQNLFTSDS